MIENIPADSRSGPLFGATLPLHSNNTTPISEIMFIAWWYTHAQEGVIRNGLCTEWSC